MIIQYKIIQTAEQFYILYIKKIKYHFDMILLFIK